MKQRLFAAAMAAAGCLFLISCGETSNVNTANKPANASNNTASANTAVSSASVDTEAKNVLADLAAVLAKNDADAAARFYTEDYRLITPTGVVQTKAERLADMRSGTTKFDTFSYEDINLRSWGDTAVAVATVKATGKVANMPSVGDMRATLVLRKMPEGWKVVSGQATPISSTPSTAANPTSNNSNAAKPGNANMTNSNR